MAHSVSSAVSLTVTFQTVASVSIRGYSTKLVQHQRHKNVRKYLFNYRVVSKLNTLDYDIHDTVTAKRVNGLKMEWEREGAKKMYLFLDW